MTRRQSSSGRPGRASVATETATVAAPQDHLGPSVLPSPFITKEFHP